MPRRGLRRVGARYLRSNALSKGLFGGSRGWMSLFVLLYGKRLMGKYVGREPQHLTTEQLAPGQSMTIRAIAPPTRKERRQGKAAAKGHS